MIVSVMYAECPQNFTYLPATGSCYQVINENLDWDAAGLRCGSLYYDAHLLIINDATEQTAVAAMLDALERQ